MNELRSFRYALFLLLAVFLSTSYAAPKKNLWPIWQAHQQESKRIIDHKAYDTFLGRYVFKGAKGINQVHYSKVNGRDKQLLINYINQLSKVPISQYNKAEQLAYWINLYNALTIRLIVDNWPVKSITKLNISPGFLSFGPWDAHLVTVEGVHLTLNDIEHRILRPIWQDSRIHYALNCASMSCPELQSHAYTANTVEETLTRAATQYVNGQFGLSLKNNELVLSKIYQWYRGDFGHDEQAVLASIAVFAKPDLKQQLLNNTLPIQYQYDWQLNGD